MKKTTHPEELIGEEIEVVSSTNKEDKGINGKVVDETKMTLQVKTSKGIKTLLKNNITIKLNKTGRMVVGETIARRPEERIKG